MPLQEYRPITRTKTRGKARDNEEKFGSGKINTVTGNSADRTDESQRQRCAMPLEEYRPNTRTKTRGKASDNEEKFGSGEIGRSHAPMPGAKATEGKNGAGNEGNAIPNRSSDQT